jgi:hypothetical protein
MVFFQAQNPKVGKFLRVLLWKMLVVFMTFGHILRPLRIFFAHLVHFVVMWYIFPVLVYCIKASNSFSCD